MPLQKKYGIPTTSLFDRVKENYNTNIVGRRAAIPWDEEIKLAYGIRTMEKWGFGLSRQEVLHLVENYVTKINWILHLEITNPAKTGSSTSEKGTIFLSKKPNQLNMLGKK